MKQSIFSFILLVLFYAGYTQNVGIGTASPDAGALLHVNLGTSTTKGFLVNGTYLFPSTVPDLGAGSRLMFYPGKAAFRAGSVDGTQWDNSNVGTYSTALGRGTTASESFSTAMGSYTIASGQYSTAMGSNTIASGTFSTAMGNSTTAKGNSSTAMGKGTTAKGFSSTVVGMYNDSILTTNQIAVTSTTPLFIVGNGDLQNLSNAMMVRKDGNVGIGTSIPDALLHVNLVPASSNGFLVSGFYNGQATMPNLGAGSRMMYYPGRSALRAGGVSGNQWDDTNVGRYSVALGYNTKANGYFTAAFNTETTAQGDASAAFGISTTASGFYSMAMGNLSRSFGNSSLAAGYNTESRGNSSSAFGYKSISKGYASMVVGMYNDPILVSDEFSSSSLTPLFIVGNGNEGATSNAMVVRKDGNVGIGNSNPEYRLDISDRIRLRGGGTNPTSAGIWLNNINNTGQVGFMGVFDNNTFGWYGTGGASWNLLMNISTGNIGIGTQNPTQKSHVIGNILATGTITPSDARFKQDIVKISNPIDKLMQLNGVTYQYKAKEFPGHGFDDKEQVGVIAQDVEKIFPQLVFTDDKGYKAVDYPKLIPVLIEAVKVQQNQIDELKKLVEKLLKQ